MQCLSNLSGVFYILRSDTSFVLGIVLFSFIFLAELISLFLKDLLSWSAMKKVETEDGKINYVRGKWNALALRDWRFFLPISFSCFFVSSVNGVEIKIKKGLPSLFFFLICGFFRFS